ncbi:MAG: SMC-Scp complex subunit ScpB [Propionibacteriaceae bacterium]|jgi:segregation and condensation protein B|nr:SMC-Scp complex subunit ScpB [Propionibacteriaceae bacterium]
MTEPTGSTAWAGPAPAAGDGAETTSPTVLGPYDQPDQSEQLDQSDQLDQLDPADRPPADPGLGAVLEALLMMATEPLRQADLAASLSREEAEVEAALAELAEFYRRTGRGFELRRVGAGWRYYTDPALAEAIGQSLVAGQQGRLSQAGLETLAVIAYLQPISRGRVSAVRGVNVDGVVRTLLARDLIAETGKDEDTGAGLLTTTDYFLERMGLTELDDLPPLAPNLPDAAQLDAELARLVAQSAGSEDGPNRVDPQPGPAADGTVGAGEGRTEPADRDQPTTPTAPAGPVEASASEDGHV